MGNVRSLAVVALALAIAQVSSATHCGCVSPYGGVNAAAAAAVAAADGLYAPGGLLPPGAATVGGPYVPGLGLEEGCCPGPVIEKKSVVTKPVTIPYSYSVPTFSKKCFNTANVDRQVIPSATVTQQCNDVITTIRVPTIDIITQQQPLCKKTCTTSEYVIQIPIIETTCTSAPLCKQTVRAQNNVLTTVAAKTACAKQTCISNNILERPIYQTVCQDFQGTINKVGAKTVLKPEVVKNCVQLPPYKCLKYTTYPTGVANADAAAYAGTIYPGNLGIAGYSSATYPADVAYTNFATYAGADAFYPVNIGFASAYPFTTYPAGVVYVDAIYPVNLVTAGAYPAANYPADVPHAGADAAANAGVGSVHPGNFLIGTLSALPLFRR